MIGPGRPSGSRRCVAVSRRMEGLVGGSGGAESRGSGGQQTRNAAPHVGCQKCSDPAATTAARHWDHHHMARPIGSSGRRQGSAADKQLRDAASPGDAAGTHGWRPGPGGGSEDCLTRPLPPSSPWTGRPESSLVAIPTPCPLAGAGPRSVQAGKPPPATAQNLHDASMAGATPHIGAYMHSASLESLCHIARWERLATAHAGCSATAGLLCPVARALSPPLAVSPARRLLSLSRSLCGFQSGSTPPVSLSGCLSGSTPPVSLSGCLSGSTPPVSLSGCLSGSTPHLSLSVSLWRPIRLDSSALAISPPAGRRPLPSGAPRR
ncbi:hypothetical protein CDD83_4270 [Cordyceps sp. RAO-2017]|nr:hypothetical protein CDD83_4270 [Cordyceps sp. RAO-2017]